MTDERTYAGYTLEELLALAPKLAKVSALVRERYRQNELAASCDFHDLEFYDELDMLTAAVPALIERIQYLVAERAQYREKLAKLLGIDPEKDSVLEAVRDLATGRDDFARRCLDWDRETYNVVTIDEVLAAVKDELAREKERT